MSAAAAAARVGAFFSQPKAPDHSVPTGGDGRVVCLEFTKGKRRVYRRKPAAGSGSGEGEGFEVTDDKVGCWVGAGVVVAWGRTRLARAGGVPVLQATAENDQSRKTLGGRIRCSTPPPAGTSQYSGERCAHCSVLQRRLAPQAAPARPPAAAQVTHRSRVRDVFQDYLLPQGYPDSVAPQYGTYMGWRGVQYFFGGGWGGAAPGGRGAHCVCCGGGVGVGGMRSAMAQQCSWPCRTQTTWGGVHLHVPLPTAPPFLPSVLGV